LVPVGWPFEGCPGRLAGPGGVPLDPRGAVDVLPVPAAEAVARGAGCPAGWGAVGRWAEPEDCDMTTAVAIAAAAATATIAAVTARRRGNRAGADAAAGKSVAGKPASGGSAAR
jgi:hypothetical protein